MHQLVLVLTRFVFEHVRAGLPVPSMIEVYKEDTSIRAVIDDLEVAINADTPDNFENQVKCIPIR